MNVTSVLDIQTTDPPSHLDLPRGAQWVTKISCKKCNEVLYDRGTEKDKDLDPDSIMIGVRLHLELMHDFILMGMKCSDPNCKVQHFF